MRLLSVAASRTRALALAVVVGTAASVAVVHSTVGQNSDTAATVPVWRLSHVALVVLENRDYDQVIGSRNAPYINSLLPRAAVASEYRGVTHPSLPNYLALTSGDTWGVTSDCSTCFQDVPNLADQLEAAGLTWKTYQEGYPGNCFLGGRDRYAQKHNPFIYYDSIRNDPSRCANILDMQALTADLASNSLPNFALLTPDQCHDGHDCPLAQADSWLSTVLPGVLASLTAPGDLAIVTWDEDDYRSGPTDGGHVATLLLGPAARAGFEVADERNHYDVLATIEDGFGLPRLGNAAFATGLAEALVH